MAGEAFLLASVIVSFLAGVVALAMPCCFSVLLPSYFASCFKRRTAIFRMTLVFTLGVAAILIPIALGVSAISIYISLNHSLLFVIGGLFMLFLGIASLLGIQLMPMMHPNVNLEKTGVTTVFALGVFSGVASSCCAPVLAGILILTALTTSIFGAALVGAAYVIGMVFPLFVVATFMDKSSSVQRFLQGKMIETRFGTMHSSRLFATVIFFSMGLLTVILGITNTMLATPGSEFFNIYEAVIQNAVEGSLSSPVLPVVFLASAVLLGAWFYRRRHSATQGKLKHEDVQAETQTSPQVIVLG
jgi:cytochrome c-type biogenesis protein